MKKNSCVVEAKLNFFFYFPTHAPTVNAAEAVWGLEILSLKVKVKASHQGLLCFQNGVAGAETAGQGCQNTPNVLEHFFRVKHDEISSVRL